MIAADRLQAVRLAIVELLTGVPGWDKPYAYWPGAVVTPCVVVAYPSSVRYHYSKTAPDLAEITLTLVAAVSRTEGDKLDSFLAPDGPFMERLHGAKHSAWKSCQVVDGGDPRITLNGQAEALSADLTLRIVA